ncbi:MAG: family 10 glycosylhydrolase, partial [Lentisphaeria bacterium]|nr:family 10 glycosylhydrolase [Lentisphaeria bacterium]
RIRALRRKVLERPRRVWFNHDGCDASSFRESDLKGKKATPQNLLDVRTTPLANTQVDTLSYCTISSGFSNFTHRTKVGHTLTVPSATTGRVNITQDLIDQGTDPLEVMVNFCHAKGMECFWSMRMNDTHDAGWKPGTGHRLFPKLKEEHPEYLVGSYAKKPPFATWTSVNYARPEIRELCYKFLEEVCQNYDVDGVEMDFFRHLCYFKSVAEGGHASTAELDMMTDLVRRIRQMTEREGIRRGKPILVAIRVPDSVEYAKGLGLDFERWLKEGLVDCLIGSGYFRFNHWAQLVELGHKYGVKVYPCLSESRIRRVKKAFRARRSDDSYRARAMNVWDAGADGVYIFN